jgi:polyhydroxybutyrate depolymerase
VATTNAPTSTTPVCSDLAVGVSEFTLTAGGADHPVRVFVPSTYAGAPVPLVVNWHGLGGNGPDQAAVTRYEELAESEGFIAVHPTGVPAAGDSRNSWQLAPTPGERDDVRFADDLLDRLIADWCVDANRVYSTGMSNGGFFTARLVCEMADRLAAASSVAGLYHVDDCAPSRPVPYLAYHGTADTVVPFDGDGQSVLLGAGSDPALRVFFEQVMPDEFAEFAADAGCDPTPTSTPIGDVIRYDYAGCADDTPMSFFEVTGGGHTWPNWPIADAVGALFGYTTTAVDATVDSWEFFEQHTLNE